MPEVIRATFAGPAGQNLDAYTGESGGVWTKFTGWNGNMVLTDANRVRMDSPNDNIGYAHSVIPPADIRVTWVVHVFSILTNQFPELRLRGQGIGDPVNDSNFYKVEIRPHADVLRVRCE